MAWAGVILLGRRVLRMQRRSEICARLHLVSQGQIHLPVRLTVTVHGRMVLRFRKLFLNVRIWYLVTKCVIRFRSIAPWMDQPIHREQLKLCYLGFTPM
ncbi:hypothetical protein UB44_11400 [Burkholderiaceae bacterium 26]|nr:hypothetical protein UB44_11400 [Burkholderiaceae bacterium 26]